MSIQLHSIRFGLIRLLIDDGFDNCQIQINHHKVIVPIDNRYISVALFLCQHIIIIIWQATAINHVVAFDFNFSFNILLLLLLMANNDENDS